MKHEVLPISTSQDYYFRMKYAEITIHPLSSSTHEERYLLCSNGRYYEASRAIVELLTELQRYETQEEAVAAYVEKKEGKYTAEQVEQIIGKFLAPLLPDSMRLELG